MYDHSDLYEQSASHCYYTLKNEVIPKFEMPYTIKMGKLKIPAGKIRLKIIETDDRVLHLRMKMQIVTFISNTIGSELRVYCHEAGKSIANVEFSAESLQATNSDILNAYINTASKISGKIPGVKKLQKIITPKYYFGNTLVLDESTFEGEDFIKYYHGRTFSCLFENLHKQLSRKICQ